MVNRDNGSGRRRQRAATEHRPIAVPPKIPVLVAAMLPVALLTLGVFAVYLRTLAPGVLGGDPGELQFVPYILSLPHPTGTPLYVLLGHLWSRLPLGASVAWRMNLLAAVSATLAVALVYRMVSRGQGHWLPGMAAGAALAFGSTFWDQALIADKYAFNALMLAAVLALALECGRISGRARQGEPNLHVPGRLYALALVYGLSLAHHRTMILVAPPLAGYLWWHYGPALKRPSHLGRLLALFLLPLGLYLYLPWAAGRGLPPGTWQPRTLAEWYAYLFDTGRTGLVYIDPGILGERLGFYGRTLWDDFGTAGVALGLIGLATQMARRRADALLLASVFVLQAFLAANHHVPRHWVYFIPSFLTFAVWIGEGLISLPAWALARSSRVHRATRLPALLIMVVIVVWMFLPWPERYAGFRRAHLGYGTLDPWRQTLKSGYMADRVGQAIVDVGIDAVIVCDWEQSTPLWYYQQVLELRPDVTIAYPIERLSDALDGDRPVYLARAVPGVGEPWYPWAETPLIALRPEPTMEVPGDVVRVGQRFENGLILEGARVQAPVRGPRDGPDAHRPGEVVALAIYWRAETVPEHDYSVSVRLYDAGGVEIDRVDAQHPVLGMRPMSQWIVGEVVADYYELQLPRELGPGPVTWGVVAYRGLPDGGWEELPVEGVDDTLAVGGTVDVIGW